MKFNFRRGSFFDSRTWILLLPAAAVLALDLPVLLTLGYSLAAIFIVVAMAHVIRRVLFHYIDLENLADRAHESATGAGLVFLSVSIIFSSIIIAASLWIAK